MNPEQDKVVTDTLGSLMTQLSTLSAQVDHLTQLVMAALVLLGGIMIALLLAHMRITKNQAITADLLREGVQRIEEDLPAIASGQKK